MNPKIQDLMATGEGQGIRKPAFSSHIQAVFSNLHLPVMKVIISLFIYNCIHFATGLASTGREEHDCYSHSHINKSFDVNKLV